MSSRNDFDFLCGSWRVVNRRLRKRLAGCDEWETFELDYDFMRLLDGQANMDRIYGEFAERYFEGMSVRTLDPKSGQWTIYWADINHPQLAENVRGRFEGRVGTFFGTDTLAGKEIKVRFIWQSLDPRHARWEQAFLDTENGEWETNWVMEFTRQSDQANWLADRPYK